MSNSLEDQKREFLYRELEYRRDKQWKMFVWYCTLMTAVIGGIGALERVLPIAVNLGLTIAIVFLAIYVEPWLRYHHRAQSKIQDTIASCHEGMFSWRASRHWLWYTHMIWLMGIAALVAVWGMYFFGDIAAPNIEATAPSK